MKDKDMRQIWIIGMGCGSIRYLTRQAGAAIRAAGLLIGSARLLSVIEEDRDHPRKTAETPAEVRAAVESAECETLAVLVPWDASQGTGQEIFHVLEDLKPLVVPGITEQAYLSSRTGADCGDAVMFYPGKTRKTLFMMLRQHRAVAVNGGAGAEEAIDAVLRTTGGGGTSVYVVEHPGTKEERAFRGSAENFRGRAIPEDSLLLFRRDGRADLSFPEDGDDESSGSEEDFLSEEIRVLAIHALGIHECDVIYDIGSGNGDLALAAAMRAPDGWVYAIESSEALAEKAKEKCGKAEAGNVTVIAGSAPAALAHLPKPDAVLIQGTGRTIKEILQILVSRNPGVRVVCLRRTVEGASEAVRLMEGMKFAPVMTEIGCMRTRKLDGRNRLEPQSPCFLISGRHRMRESDV